MEKILLNQFALGFYVGAVLFLMCYYHLVRLKMEHKRYRRMLSDKMEMDAAAVSKQKGELEVLRKENENLRVKVQALSLQPEQKLSRDLEIFARAEKKLNVAAPGFAGSWEQAKQAAHQEMAEEESGRSAPRSLFQRFFGGSSSEPTRALPQGADDAAKPPAPAAS